MAKNAPQQQLAPWQMAPPVEFKPLGANAVEVQQRLIAVRQCPGLPVAAGQVAHATLSRATHVLLDYSQNAVALRYQIDGVWENLPPLDRAAGDAMLVAIKTATGLNPGERRAAQKASVPYQIQRDKFDLNVQTQGVASGERVLLAIRPKKPPFTKLVEIGMREKAADSLRAAMNAEGGIVLITAPKSEGLSTTWQVAVESTDRFVRDWHSLSAKGSDEPEFINVTPNNWEPGVSESAAVLDRLLLKQPDAFIVPEIADEETLKILVEQARDEQRTLITRIVANDAADGLARFLSKYRNLSKDLVGLIRCVTGQRLVRRLCDTCKRPFPPPPALLQRLGLPPGSVSMLFQQYVLPPPEQQVDEKGRPIQMQPCPACGGRGFFGRTGVIELLEVTKELREQLPKTGADPAKIRALAKSLGHKGFQEEGILSVVRGATTLEELKRILQPVPASS
jgi:type II secretory ATPase GspE/PulE/Tfp pilus assembly ATPase PilB-like protein